MGARVVDDLDDLAQMPVDGTSETGAENRVHGHGRALQLALQPPEVRAGGKLYASPAEIDVGVVVDARIAGHLLAGARQKARHIESAGKQVTSYDEPVATVVARAANDDDARPAADRIAAGARFRLLVPCPLHVLRLDFLDDVGWPRPRFHETTPGTCHDSTKLS